MTTVICRKEVGLGTEYRSFRRQAGTFLCCAFTGPIPCDSGRNAVWFRNESPYICTARSVFCCSMCPFCVSTFVILRRNLLLVFVCGSQFEQAERPKILMLRTKVELCIAWEDTGSAGFRCLGPAASSIKETMIQENNLNFGP